MHDRPPKLLGSLLRQLIIVLLAGFVLTTQAQEAYWQQKVSYDIEVTLDDSRHHLQGREQITYINHSPDSLHHIWMHLWPNAYSSNQTPLAREKFRNFSTRMYFWEADDFGWIQIDSVKADQQEIHWEYRSADSTDVARFDLPHPLAPRDTLILDLVFELKMPATLSRLAHIGQHYEFTQWYPKPAVYDSRGWHAMSYLDQGEFYSEWGDYDVRITLPASYRVAATGVLQEVEEREWLDSLAQIGNQLMMQLNQRLDGEANLSDSINTADTTALKTITFIQDNVHDFAWFADKQFMLSSQKIQLNENREINAWTYFLPQNAKCFRLSNTYAAQAIQDFSSWFMEYPYENITIVDGGDSRGGGMEYPMITLINAVDFQPVMEVSIMHEIGHNWFYGLLGSNERQHPWIDEGFTTYAENRYWRTHYPGNPILAFHDEPPGYVRWLNRFLRNGTKSALEEMQYYLLAKPGIDQAPNLPSEELSSRNYAVMTYAKAGAATETLHDYLGTGQMDSLWNSLFELWAYRHPYPEDLRKHFEQFTGQELSWYFDGLIGSTAKVDYGLKKIQSKASEDHNKVQLLVSNFGDISPPLSIGLSGPQGEIDSLFWMRPSLTREIIQIETEFPIHDIQLDPYNKLLDMDRRNNRLNRQLDLNFMKIDLNPDGNYVINTIPYIWYSAVNKFMPGLIITHDDLIDWGGIDWYTRSNFGPVSKTIGMVASIGKTLYPGNGRILNLNGRYGRDWYYNLIEGSSRFSRIYPFASQDQNEWTLTYTNLDVTPDGRVFGGDTTFALDPDVWTHDRSFRIELDHERAKVLTLSKNLRGFTFTFGDGQMGKQWTKFQAYLEMENRHNKQLRIKTTFYAGQIWGENPQQERFYLSTSMDPALADGLVLSRNEAWYAPGHFQLYTTPYTLPGFLFDSETQQIPRTNALAGAKIEIDHSRLFGIKALMGTGIMVDETSGDTNGYGSFSMAYDIGPWRLYYTPFSFMGHKADLAPVRFQLFFSMPSGGFLGM